MPVFEALEKVFPTPVGMNRYLSNNYVYFCSVPHTRGDEPSE